MHSSNELKIEQFKQKWLSNEVGSGILSNVAKLEDLGGKSTDVHKLDQDKRLVAGWDFLKENTSHIVGIRQKDEPQGQSAEDFYNQYVWRTLDELVNGNNKLKPEERLYSNGIVHKGLEDWKDEKVSERDDKIAILKDYLPRLSNDYKDAPTTAAAEEIVRMYAYLTREGADKDEIFNLYHNMVESYEAYGGDETSCKPGILNRIRRDAYQISESGKKQQRTFDDYYARYIDGFLKEDDNHPNGLLLAFTIYEMMVYFNCQDKAVEEDKIQDITAAMIRTIWPKIQARMLSYAEGIGLPWAVAMFYDSDAVIDLLMDRVPVMIPNSESAQEAWYDIQVAVIQSLLARDPTLAKEKVCQQASAILSDNIDLNVLKDEVFFDFEGFSMRAAIGYCKAHAEQDATKEQVVAQASKMLGRKLEVSDASYRNIETVDAGDVRPGCFQDAKPLFIGAYKNKLIQDAQEDDENIDKMFSCLSADHMDKEICFKIVESIEQGIPVSEDTLVAVLDKLYEMKETDKFLLITQMIESRISEFANEGRDNVFLSILKGVGEKLPAMESIEEAALYGQSERVEALLKTMSYNDLKGMYSGKKSKWGSVKRARRTCHLIKDAYVRALFEKGRQSIKGMGDKFGYDMAVGLLMDEKYFDATLSKLIAQTEDEDMMSDAIDLIKKANGENLYASDFIQHLSAKHSDEFREKLIQSFPDQMNSELYGYWLTKGIKPLEMLDKMGDDFFKDEGHLMMLIYDIVNSKHLGDRGEVLMALIKRVGVDGFPELTEKAILQEGLRRMRDGDDALSPIGWKDLIIDQAANNQLSTKAFMKLLEIPFFRIDDRMRGSLALGAVIQSDRPSELILKMIERSENDVVSYLENPSLLQLAVDQKCDIKVIEAMLKKEAVVSFGFGFRDLNFISYLVAEKAGTELLKASLKIFNERSESPLLLIDAIVEALQNDDQESVSILIEALRSQKRIIREKKMGNECFYKLVSECLKLRNFNQGTMRKVTQISEILESSFGDLVGEKWVQQEPFFSKASSLNTFKFFMEAERNIPQKNRFHIFYKACKDNASEEIQLYLLDKIDSHIWEPFQVVRVIGLAVQNKSTENMVQTLVDKTNYNKLTNVDEADPYILGEMRDLLSNQVAGKKIEENILKVLLRPSLISKRLLLEMIRARYSEDLVKYTLSNLNETLNKSTVVLAKECGYGKDVQEMIKGKKLLNKLKRTVGRFLTPPRGNSPVGTESLEGGWIEIKDSDGGDSSSNATLEDQPESTHKNDQRRP